MPLTCPDCAKPIQPAWRLCPHCGQPLTAVADLRRILSAEEPHADGVATRPQTRPGRPPNRWMLAGLLAVGLLGFAILALPAVMELVGIH